MMQINSLFIPDLLAENTNKGKANLGLKNFSYLFSNIFNIQKNEIDNNDTTLVVDDESSTLPGKNDFLLDVSFLLDQKNEKSDNSVLSILSPFISTNQIESANNATNSSQNDAVIQTIPMTESDFLAGLKNILDKFLKSNSKSKAKTEITFSSLQNNLTLKPDKKLIAEIDKLVHSELENQNNFSIVLKKNGTDIFIDVETHPKENAGKKGLQISETGAKPTNVTTPNDILNENIKVTGEEKTQSSNGLLAVVQKTSDGLELQIENKHIDTKSNLPDKNIISNNLPLNKIYSINDSISLKEENGNNSQDVLPKIFSLKNNLLVKNDKASLNGNIPGPNTENLIDNISTTNVVSPSPQQIKSSSQFSNDSIHHQNSEGTNQPPIIKQSILTQSNTTMTGNHVNQSNNNGIISQESTTSKVSNLSSVKISNNLSYDATVKSISTSNLDQLMKSVNVEEIILKESSQPLKNKFSTSDIVDKLDIGSGGNIKNVNDDKTISIIGRNIKSNTNSKNINPVIIKSDLVQNKLAPETFSDIHQSQEINNSVSHDKPIKSVSPRSTNTNIIEVSNPDLQRITSAQSQANISTVKENSSIKTKEEASSSDSKTENTFHLKTKSLKVDSVRIEGAPHLIVGKNIIQSETESKERVQNNIRNSVTEDYSHSLINEETSDSATHRHLNIFDQGKIEVKYLDKNISLDKSNANSNTIKTEQTQSAFTEQSELEVTTKGTNIRVNTSSVFFDDPVKNNLVTNIISEQKPSRKIPEPIIKTQNPEIIELPKQAGVNIKPNDTISVKSKVINVSNSLAEEDDDSIPIEQIKANKVPINQNNVYMDGIIEEEPEKVQTKSIFKTKSNFTQKHVNISVSDHNFLTTQTDFDTEPTETIKTQQGKVLKYTFKEANSQQKINNISLPYSTQPEQLSSKAGANVQNSSLSNPIEKNVILKQSNNFELTDNTIDSKISITTSDKPFSDHDTLNFNHSGNKELKDYSTPPKGSGDLNEVKNNSRSTIQNQNITFDESATSSEEILSNNFPIKDVEENIPVSKEPKVFVKENAPSKLISTSKMNLENNFEEYSNTANLKSETQIKSNPKAESFENAPIYTNTNPKFESTVKSSNIFQHSINENVLMNESVFNQKSPLIYSPKNNNIEAIETSFKKTTDQFDEIFETEDSNNFKNIPIEKSKINLQERVIGPSSFESHKEEISIKGQLGFNQSINDLGLSEEEVQIDNFKNIPIKKSEINLKEKVIEPSSFYNHKEEISLKRSFDVNQSFNAGESSDEKVQIHDFSKQVFQSEKSNLKENIDDADANKIVGVLSDSDKEADNKSIEPNKIHLKIKINSQNTFEVIDKKQSTSFKNVFSIIEDHTKTFTKSALNEIKSNLNSDHEMKSSEIELKSENTEQKKIVETNSENGTPTQEHSKEDAASYKVLHNQVNNKMENKIEHPGKEPLQFRQVRTSELVKEIYKIIESGETKSVAMKLIPENLGSVKILLDTIDSQVTARVEVENQTVQKLIQTNVEVLKQSLQQNGVQLNSINVTLSGSEQKQSNLHGNKKRFQQQNNERKIDSADEKISIKNFGYNTYEFLA